MRKILYILPLFVCLAFISCENKQMKKEKKHNEKMMNQKKMEKPSSSNGY